MASIGTWRQLMPYPMRAIIIQLKNQPLSIKLKRYAPKIIVLKCQKIAFRAIQTKNIFRRNYLFSSTKFTKTYLSLGLGQP